jgi:hypothetical protein
VAVGHGLFVFLQPAKPPLLEVKLGHFEKEFDLSEMNWPENSKVFEHKYSTNQL